MYHQESQEIKHQLKTDGNPKPNGFHPGTLSGFSSPSLSSGKAELSPSPIAETSWSTLRQGRFLSTCLDEGPVRASNPANPKLGQ